MMFASPALGMIPDYQFSTDPAVNININPHVKIPVEWPNGQRTIQPVGDFSAKTCGDPLARTDGLTPMNGLGCPNPTVAGARVTGLGNLGLGITIAHWQKPRADLGAIEIFDSWAWRNRKPLVIVGVGLLGLAALAGVGAILR